MKTVEQISNTYLKFRIFLLTELPTLKYVYVHVKGHSCLLALFLSHVT